MEFRTIRQTSHIEGVNRNPGPSEHLKALVWDDNIVNPDGSNGKIKYVAIDGILPNSKTDNGYVSKGDTSAAGEYIWKLDSYKNPAWRKEEYLKTITRSGNHAIFTMNSGAAIDVALGALAWEDSVANPVTSVFGRTGDIIATLGDYTADQVTNAFDKTADNLDDISEGSTNKHFTATIKSDVIANTAARHIHSNEAILDQISDAGGGVIPSAAQITEWSTYTPDDAQNVMDTVAAFIQNATGITFTYDDNANTLTPAINLGDFSTDDLPEGATNKYYKETDRNVFNVKLPSNTTVSGRISGSTEGIDYPTGWVLTASPSEYDISINHGLGRTVASVSVLSIDGAGIERVLVPFNSAFTGWYVSADKDSLIVEGLSTKETAIRINIIFV